MFTSGIHSKAHSNVGRALPHDWDRVGNSPKYVCRCRNAAEAHKAAVQSFHNEIAARDFDGMGVARYLEKRLHD